LARANCECGCGWEGVDEVTQFCVEEAAALVVNRLENEQIAAEEGKSEATMRHEEIMRKHGGR
jgi:hypothetical protein